MVAQTLNPQYSFPVTKLIPAFDKFSKNKNVQVGVKNEFNFGKIKMNLLYNFNKNDSKDDLFEYISFAMILQKLANTAGDCRFGFPYIGMGLAGGDPVKIITLLEHFSASVEEKGGSATLVEFG